MRAFLAIPWPEGLRGAAAAARSVLAEGGSGWRFTRDEGLHLTIRFLGEVEPERAEALHEVWRAAASGTGLLQLRAEGARLFPTASRPRVVGLGVSDAAQDGALARLAARVERAARAAGFPPEERPFAAHVTLARARRGARVTAPPFARIGDLGAFVADRLVLYSSELQPGGSLYREIASYPFTEEPGA